MKRFLTILLSLLFAVTIFVQVRDLPSWEGKIELVSYRWILITAYEGALDGTTPDGHRVIIPLKNILWINEG